MRILNTLLLYMYGYNITHMITIDYFDLVRFAWELGIKEIVSLLMYKQKNRKKIFDTLFFVPFEYGMKNILFL